MNTQKFYRPGTITEVLDALDTHKENIVIVNGGTDIVERLSSGRISPEAVMYIRNVAELNYIREENGYVAVGGIVTYRAMLESSLCRHFSGLMQALTEIGSPPIRAVATPAGNIGTAASGADCNVALMALGASVVLASKSGERVLSYKELFSGPRKTCLQHEELIREIRIPNNATAGSAFIKLAKRKAQDIAQVSTCVCLETAGNVCTKVTVSLGAVAATVIRAESMEQLIVNKNMEDAVMAVRNFVPPEVSLRSPRNRAYKEAVIGVIVGRALKKAYAGSGVN